MTTPRLPIPPTITGVPASSGCRRTSTLAKNASMSTCRTVHPADRSRALPPPSIEHVFDAVRVAVVHPLRSDARRSMSSPNPPRARATRRADVSTGAAGVRRIAARRPARAPGPARRPRSPAQGREPAGTPGRRSRARPGCAPCTCGCTAAGPPDRQARVPRLEGQPPTSGRCPAQSPHRHGPDHARRRRTRPRSRAAPASPAGRRCRRPSSPATPAPAGPGRGRVGQQPAAPRRPGPPRRCPLPGRPPPSTTAPRRAPAPTVPSVQPSATTTTSHRDPAPGPGAATAARQRGEAAPAAAPPRSAPGPPPRAASRRRHHSCSAAATEAARTSPAGAATQQSSRKSGSSWTATRGQSSAAAQRRVHRVPGLRVVGHRVPPVDGDQGAARSHGAAAAAASTSAEVAGVEVVEDLRQHHQVDGGSGSPASQRCSTRTPAMAGGPARGRARRRRR